MGDILAVLELFVGGFCGWADDLEDLLAHLFDDIGALCDFVEEPGKGCGGGVSGGEEDGNELVAEDDAVAGVLGEGVEEVVAWFVLGLELGRAEVKGTFDVGIDKVVQDRNVSVVLAAWNQFPEGPIRITFHVSLSVTLPSDEPM